MTLHVKRPIALEAVQFNPVIDIDNFVPGGNIDEEWIKLGKFTGFSKIKWVSALDSSDARTHYYVYDYLHNSWIEFNEGDWIVKGIRGEFAPVERSVFERTYAEYAEDQDGVGIIAQERTRQVAIEGYTPEKDIGRSEELVTAAVSYLAYNSAFHEYGVILTVDETPWPWNPRYFKPSADPVENLKKAGALIAAAIDATKNENKQ
ncbi:hypothetical protein SEA_ZOOMAN_182 [Microbacterium phage Zooman]|nr:hypothetical protein SEA_ZOOMAN_182 [Microbacterium phage Zooman]